MPVPAAVIWGLLSLGSAVAKRAMAPKMPEPQEPTRPRPRLALPPGHTALQATRQSAAAPQRMPQPNYLANLLVDLGASALGDYATSPTTPTAAAVSSMVPAARVMNAPPVAPNALGVDTALRMDPRVAESMATQFPGYQGGQPRLTPPILAPPPTPVWPQFAPENRYLRGVTAPQPPAPYSYGRIPARQPTLGYHIPSIEPDLLGFDSGLLLDRFFPPTWNRRR